MGKKLTRLQNGTLSVTPVSMYVCIYVSLLTSNFVYIGGGKQSQEMRDL